MNKSGERLHFTFFVSGTNLIADASRMLYQGPRQRRGYSSIKLADRPTTWRNTLNSSTQKSKSADNG
jgi:hypothetical protein